MARFFSFGMICSAFFVLIVSKEKKRNISADARADFEKAMKRYQDAKKEDGLSRSECSSVADAFKRVADDTAAKIAAAAAKVAS